MSAMGSAVALLGLVPAGAQAAGCREVRTYFNAGGGNIRAADIAAYHVGCRRARRVIKHFERDIITYGSCSASRDCAVPDGSVWWWCTGASTWNSAGGFLVTCRLDRRTITMVEYDAGGY